MKVVGYRILAEKIVPQTTNASGIHLPLSEQNQYRAKVLLVGDKVDFPEIKPGVEVQYFQGAGVPYEYEGKQCLFLKAGMPDTDIEFVI